MPDDLQHSLTDLLQQLVRIPSRAGTDSCDGILTLLEGWLSAHGVVCHGLTDQGGRRIALAGHLGDVSHLPAYVLNAPVDTAGFGDPQAWTRDPTSAALADGWLHGRGSADCKAGIAIFCHLLAAFRNRRIARPLAFVFDADEHTGRFGGMRAFVDWFKGSIAGAMIGYPGHERICIGARGFWRATIEVHGIAAHSGSARPRGINAIVTASHVVRELEWREAENGAPADQSFPLPPKFTVTGVRGGGEFSLVPDSCEIDIDVRLTPSFTAQRAETEIRAILDRVDAQAPSAQPSRIARLETWPAYRLAESSPLAAALARAGEQVLGRPLACIVAGPSNVGNLLAARNIDATCGFGVSFRNVHAADECVDLSSLEPAYRVYERALEQLLGSRAGPN